MATTKNDKDDLARYEQFVAIQRRIEHGRRIRNGCRCDCCGQTQAVDVHEIFPRDLTRNSTYERDLCYSRYVISMLCRECHGKYQNDPVINRELLLLNKMEFWGATEVDKHLAKMKEAGINMSFQDRLLDK